MQQETIAKQAVRIKLTILWELCVSVGQGLLINHAMQQQQQQQQQQKNVKIKIKFIVLRSACHQILAMAAFMLETIFLFAIFTSFTNIKHHKLAAGVCRAGKKATTNLTRH